MVSDSPRSRVPIGRERVGLPDEPGFAARHRAPPRTDPADLVWLLGLVIIGRQIALSYADAESQQSQLFTLGSGGYWGQF